MPDEKLDLSNNKNDLNEGLVNEIKINNKKGDDSNNNDHNLNNIFCPCNINLRQNLPLINMKLY